MYELKRSLKIIKIPIYRVVQPNLPLTNRDAGLKVYDISYEIYINVDGACRGNRRYNAIAAAAVVIYSNSGYSKIRSTRLPNNPIPTNQSAKLTAVI